MEDKALYIAVLFVFELYEASWQKADSFKGIIKNIFKRYDKGQIYFYLSHPTFWFVLYTATKFNITNLWMTTLILLKAGDIAFKLWIIQSYQKGKNIDEILDIPQDIESSYMVYLNTFVYTILFYLALF